MTREELIEHICPTDASNDCSAGESGTSCSRCDEMLNGWLDEYDAKVRSEVLREVVRAMYHQCFECDNDEDMQKWDSGNWFRYKLFQNVIKQIKEQKE